MDRGQWVSGIREIGKSAGFLLLWFRIPVQLLQDEVDSVWEMSILGICTAISFLFRRGTPGKVWTINIMEAPLEWILAVMGK